MKKFIGLFSLIIMLFSANAGTISKYGADANAIVLGAEEIRIDDRLMIPSYIRYNSSSQPNFSGWVNYFKETFSLENSYSFRLISSSTDELGINHHRYIQTYNDINIEFAMLMVHERNNKILSINGTAYNQENLYVNPSISFEQGLTIAKSHMGAQFYKWESIEEENHLKEIENDPTVSYFPQNEMVFIPVNGALNQNQIRLTRKYNLYAIEPLGRTEYYVDVIDGSIVFEQELIHTTNKPGVANTGYSGTRNIYADSIGDNLFRLRETVRGNGISTFDMNNSTQHGQAIDFLDSNNVWSNSNGNLDQYAGDAHWGAEMMYDYLDSIHQRNSIDGIGFALRSYIHYGNQYNNAFWDGQRMTYGDGNGLNTPLTSIDIAGHEIAHGLTNFTAGLIYRSESGALNESFSDIFGASVENFGRPNNWNWLLGEDIGSAFRSLSDPNQFGDPDTYDGVNWISQNCTPTRNNDWCGVHTNSGVQNYWFFILSQGRSGVNDIGDTFNISGLGIIDAAKVAYRNLTVYLGPNSNFDDARFYAIQSAVDLFGGCSFEVEQVTNAWYAVGVGSQYTQGVDANFFATNDTLFCTTPALASFSSNSNNVTSYKWKFGDGDSSSLAKPNHVYSSAGMYSVSLLVDGGVCGADTAFRTSYINIDTTAFCSYSMIRNANFSLADCSGRLFDNGGLNGDYEIRSYDTVVIEPANADFIYLMFDSLDVESGYGGFCNHDYIEVFDGADVNSKSLGRFCSVNLPPDTIVSSTPKLTIVLSSDDITQKAGFSARWSCQSSIQLPIAEFEIKYDTICTGFNSFFDRTTNGVSSWLWSFGDGGTSTDQNPMHEYVTNGSYTVSLTSTNSMGNDINTKTASVFVNRPISPVTLNDTSCIGGNVSLAATGSGTLNWYRDQITTQKVFTGDTFRLFGLNNDTSYYVDNYEEQPRVIGSPLIISGNGGNSDTTAELYFDVYKPTLLESVVYRSARAGVRVIDLRNGRGEIIDSRTFQFSNVPNQIQLNFEIAPGTGYSLSIANRNPSAFVNFTGANYPYAFGNFMSITGSSMGGTAYPYFYFVNARELPCVSTRQLVRGIVDTSCVVTAINDQEVSLNSTTVYPNPFEESFIISRSSDKLFGFQLYDLLGKLYIQKQNISNRAEEVLIEDLPKGVYMLRISEGEYFSIKKLVKQ